MTGSFLFVKPSDPEGKPGTAYSSDSPTYAYDRASWEWMLERSLRRTLLPWALTKSHSKVILYGHEDKYSMHRWGSYGYAYDAGRLPSEYEGISQGAPGHNTDAYLSKYDRETPLPESWNYENKVPIYSNGTKVAYGIVDLEESVARLPFSLEWLHPDWSSKSLEAWDLTASTKEATTGSSPDSNYGFNWTWETTVNHIPYTIPNDPPFKCLSHMRTDDPTDTVFVTNDDNGEIEVETAPTPMSAPRTTDGSIRDYHGTQVREASYGASYRSGWALSEFYITHRYGLDYSPSTDSHAYGRAGKTSDANYESSSLHDFTLGCLIDIPDKDSMNIIVARITANYDGARFIHDVDWGGKPTWWHAKGFPKGLDSVISPKLKYQLKSLCPKCQPAIPPAIPAFLDKFPGSGRLPWVHSPMGYPKNMYPNDWMHHLALACTPIDMSERLDAMTTTVHRVPYLFAKIKTVTSKYSSTRNVYVETDNIGVDHGSQSWYEDTNREVVTVEGSSHDPITYGSGLTSVSGNGSGTTNDKGSSSAPNYYSRWSNKTNYEWEESFKSNSDFIVCLRSTTLTTMSTKTTTNTYHTEKSSSKDPIISESESSSGNLPDSYDPDPDDLLFPDWLLPWIDTAELFAYIESRLVRLNGADYNEYSYHYDPYDGEDTKSYYGRGSGTRTHKMHRKIVSLGKMDTLTGRFPAIDAASIITNVDPDATDPTGWSHYGDNTDNTVTKTTDSNGNTTELDVVTVKANVRNYRSRFVSYYVVVKWKFDRTDPETLETESPLAKLYRNLADANKALYDKNRELSDAKSALLAAQSDLKSAKDALEHAQNQLDNPEESEAGLVSEAQAAYDAAVKVLSDARAEKDAAKADYDSAESDMKDSESSMQKAQEAYDAAVKAGEGVEDARAALESAFTEYNKTVEAYDETYNKLIEAETKETLARKTADAAKDYLDTLHDKIDEVLKKSVDDAKASFDEATSRVDEWTKKVNGIEKEIPSLETVVESAKKAIRDAGGVVIN